jgi:adenylylsulfate kinase
MGRPAAGKSTLANRAEEYIRDRRFNVENLDGDEIRQNLHPDLGFTQEERRINNRRTAFIAKLLNRNGIAVVTGMITPFREAQRQAREIVEPDGEFILVSVRCSVEECERRDPKGLYQQARDGKLENFTGINHPFQEPHNPDIVVDTENSSIDSCVEHVLTRLHEFDVFDDEAEGEYGIEMSKSEESEIMGRLDDLGYLE